MNTWVYLRQHQRSLEAKKSSPFSQAFSSFRSATNPFRNVRIGPNQFPQTAEPSYWREVREENKAKHRRSLTWKQVCGRTSWVRKQFPIRVIFLQRLLGKTTSVTPAARLFSVTNLFMLPKTSPHPKFYRDTDNELEISWMDTGIVKPKPGQTLEQAMEAYIREQVLPSQKMPSFILSSSTTLVQMVVKCNHATLVRSH